jgi:exonuclease SbcD
MIRLIHTADWHLGHRLHGVDRSAEHVAFLDWLVDTLREREADALLICGDIFDSSNPSAEAQQLWYRFLARCRDACPRLDVIAIGGNHDSAGRLEAPRPLLLELGIRVVGGLPRAGREVDAEGLLFPITDRGGEVGAIVAAVPFLRAPDLPLAGGEDPLVAGVERIYREILGAARREAGGERAVVAMGHLYLTGTRISELSERKVLGGNQHALPAGMFGEDVAYAALGHLHLAQAVGRENVRYAGSVLPLSISERDYPHQVVEVLLDGARFVEAAPIPVPRVLEVMRLPERGSLPVEELLSRIAALPPAEGAGREPPLLEICALLERPEPGLRRLVEEALEGRHARLVVLTTELTGTGRAPADRAGTAALADLTPEQVFRLAWGKEYGEDPPPEMLEAFHELVDRAAQGEGR